MSLNVPPIGTRGLYSLKAPFSTLPNELYECGAIRFFKDVENQGLNVFKRYYEAYGLTQTDYQRDQTANAVIVTLISDTKAPIYLPSSYILAFPGLTSVQYQHVVLSASLGPLPTTLDLTFVKDQVAAAIAATTGVTPEVFENVAESTGAVTPEQHDALEAARQAAITISTTDRAQYLEERAKRIVLQEKLTALEQLVIAEGLLN